MNYAKHGGQRKKKKKKTGVQSRSLQLEAEITSLCEGKRTLVFVCLRWKRQRMDKGDKRLTSSFQVTLLGQTKSIFGPCPICSHIVPISKGHLSVSSTDAESEVDLVDNLVGRSLD